MNYDILFLLIFALILLLFYLKNKSKFEIQGKVIALYRTSLGLKLMDKLSNIPNWLKKTLCYISIFIGFAGMAAIFVLLIQSTWKLIFIPNTPPALAPVLPGVSIPGLPKLSFFHWIISIFLVATIHEFSHGIFARFFKIKIKSSGFAFFGPVLAAFVEPSEEEMKKRSKFTQLSVFSAGPFSNIVTGLLLLLISVFLISPAAASVMEYRGVQIVSLEEGLPASNAGLNVNDQILKINNQNITDIDIFQDAFKTISPGDEIEITTQNSTHLVKTIASPSDKDKAYIGVMIASTESGIKESVSSKFGNFFPMVLIWIAKLFFWLYSISLGIALFNLLPLGPVDGGRMFYTALTFFFSKSPKKVSRIWGGISILVLLLIVINLMPFILKLLNWIFSPLLSLIL